MTIDLVFERLYGVVPVIVTVYVLPDKAKLVVDIEIVLLDGKKSICPSTRRA